MAGSLSVDADPVTEATTPGIAERVREVRQRIADACTRAGRNPNDVTLIGVSKTWPTPSLRDALAAGIDDLGENRVQELAAKVREIGRGPRWHLIGSLQSNKVRDAVGCVDLIHSVDRVDLGRAIGKQSLAVGSRSHVLLQVNVADRDTQGGFAVNELPTAFDALLRVDGIELGGLMCIAPDASSIGGVAHTRPFFATLAELHAHFAPMARDAGHSWHALSMGMTGDFEVAIEEGATHVRVGRAIFGERSG